MHTNKSYFDFQTPGVLSPLTVLITVMGIRIGVGAPPAVALQGERRGLESQQHSRLPDVL